MLSGWAGSGKDSAAALLMEEMRFTRFAFADALREDIAPLAKLPMYMFTESCFKDRYLSEKCSLYPTATTPRELLLQHAAHIRTADPDIYGRIVANKIRTSSTHKIVISDWRHVSEYNYLRTSLPEATIIRCRVVRPDIIPTDHPTEHDLDAEPMDIIIHNDGCISDLRTNLHHLIDSIRHLKQGDDLWHATSI